MEWTDNIDKAKLISWLKARETKVPSGIGDPFSTSLRSTKRFFDSLSGKAQSRKLQQETDLTSAGLFDRANNQNTLLGNAYLRLCEYFGLDKTEFETAFALILFSEAIKRRNSFYIELITFWLNIANKIGFNTMKSNLEGTYLLSRMTELTGGYTPIKEVIINKDTFPNITIDNLQSFVDDPTILTLSNNGKLRNNIKNWLNRDSRKEMFQALEILYSNNKSETIDSMFEGAENKILKNIIQINMEKSALNMILYGPPGTGKTYNTINLSLSCIKGIPCEEIQKRKDNKIEFDKLLKSGQIRFVTFHQSYSYEDFVEGIKAVSVNGVISYEIESGIFKKICEEASKPENSTKPYVIIIDEINRGNISNIFGELITLIEPSKRKGCDDELSATLTYSNQSFTVPNNLYIIGTMNSADKSIALIDTALRRRFEFIEYMPKPELLKTLTIDGVDVDLKEMLETINKRIEILMDKNHTIGHAYLINVTDKDSLRNALVNKIIPLVEEYFYNDYEKIRLIFGDDDAMEKEIEDQIFIESSNYDQKYLFGREIDGYEDKRFFEMNKKLTELEVENIPVSLFTKIYKK